jgi:hypothetical protein
MRRLARAAVAVTLLLGTIEAVQIHLPGRVDLTGPFCAILVPTGEAQIHKGFQLFSIEATS